MILELPYPPSVNGYWRSIGHGRVIISERGREYRKHVCSIVQFSDTTKMLGRLAVTIHLHPPDRRRRDVDNPLKSVLDALAHAGVYDDDSQIDKLTIERRELRPGGEALVLIEPHQPEAKT